MVTTTKGTRGEGIVVLPGNLGAKGPQVRWSSGQNPPGSGDGGGGGENQPPDDSSDTSGDRYRVAVWVAIVAILVTFVSLTTIYILRARLAPDWQPIPLPRLLLVSTALILASSFTVQAAPYYLAHQRIAKYRRALWSTLLLGLCFIGTQFIVWRTLAGEGLYRASNPHSSFFFLLTGAHAVHLFGGVFALFFLLLRAWGEKSSHDPVGRRHSLTSSIAVYWHFMDVLWIYLFVLLFAWR